MKWRIQHTPAMRYLNELDCVKLDSLGRRLMTAVARVDDAELLAFF